MIEATFALYKLFRALMLRFFPVDFVVVVVAVDGAATKKCQSSPLERESFFKSHYSYGARLGVCANATIVAESSSHVICTAYSTSVRHGRYTDRWELEPVDDERVSCAHLTHLLL